MTYCFIATPPLSSTRSRTQIFICTIRKKIVKGNLVSIFGVLTFSQFQSKFKIFPSGMQEAEAMDNPKWYINSRRVCYLLQTYFCLRRTRTSAFQVASDSFSNHKYQFKTFFSCFHQLQLCPLCMKVICGKQSTCYQSPASCCFQKKKRAVQ